MKKKVYFLLMIISSLCISETAYSQFGILKKVGKETEKKVKKGAEDMIVDKVSDELSRRALKSIDKATDDMLRDAYRREHGDKYTDEQIDSIMASGGADYSKFVAAMNKCAELEDTYQFDVIMDVQTKDYDKKKYDMKMYFSSSQPIFAILQIENDKKMYLLLDNEKELMAMFSEENGVKSSQAYSMNMYSAHHTRDQKGKSTSSDGSFMGIMKVTRTGKTKKILSYESYQVKAEGKESEFKAYFSEEVPIQWSHVFSPMMKNVAPDCFNDDYKKLEGAMLENESKRLEDGKKATWKTKKILLDQNFSLKKTNYPCAIDSH